MHGSAPDIAGRDLANPIATLLSFAMMLRYSFDLNEDADMIERAVQNVLNGGTRTSDIMAPGMARCSTSVMGELDHPRTGEGGGVSITAVTDKKARRMLSGGLFYLSLPLH